MSDEGRTEVSDEAPKQPATAGRSSEQSNPPPAAGPLRHKMRAVSRSEDSASSRSGDSASQSEDPTSPASSVAPQVAAQPDRSADADGLGAAGTTSQQDTAPTAVPDTSQQIAPEQPAAKILAKTAAPPAPPAVKDTPRERVTLPGQMTDELEREIQEMEAALGSESLDELLDSGVAAGELQPEDRVPCTVLSLHREDALVDMGSGRQGAVPLRQFGEEPPAPGDGVELQIVRFNAAEGLFELTLPNAAVDAGNWDEVEEGMVVQAVVTGHNKGGLDCTVGSLRAFLPVSQIALYRVDELEEFVGQSFPCLITEANPERRNLVISRRAVLEREQKEAREKLLAELEVGQIREGVVRNLKPFGAFVDLGGVDGLIHVSQLSWDRIDNPAEVLELGQKVKVRVEKIAQDTGKISLSYRDLMDNPWDHVEEKYEVGKSVTGQVSKLMDFGAFVRLEPGIEGLVHISEISHKRVLRVSNFFEEGQQVEVQVMSIDRPNQRISLSTKALEAAPQKVSAKQQEEEALLDQLEQAAKPKKKSLGPLKGGMDSTSGGEQFGLKW